MRPKISDDPRDFSLYFYLSERLQREEDEGRGWCRYFVPSRIVDVPPKFHAGLRRLTLASLAKLSDRARQTAINAIVRKYPDQVRNAMILRDPDLVSRLPCEQVSARNRGGYHEP